LEDPLGAGLPRAKDPVPGAFAAGLSKLVLCHGSTASITPLFSYFVDQGEITYLASSMVTFTDAGTLKTSVPPSIFPMGMMPGDGIDSLSYR
jgi:hypothetical protein